MWGVPAQHCALQSRRYAAPQLREHPGMQQPRAFTRKASASSYRACGKLGTPEGSGAANRRVPWGAGTQVQRFRSALIQAGRVCTVRGSRGDDEMAACGQLGDVGALGARAPVLRAPPRFQEALLASA